MTNAEDSKLKLVRAGTDLFLEKGYCATGLSEILQCANVSKGSFYHYFSNKADFCIEVLEYYKVSYDKHFDLLSNRSIDPLERLDAFFKTSIFRLEKDGFRGGCLVGNISQEMSNQSFEICTKVNEIFDAWENKIFLCLEEIIKDYSALRHLEPRMLSAFIWNGWEGAILRAKASKSRKPLEQFVHVIFSISLQKNQDCQV
jgi:TetR/AcrR family transcriptional repressor of nem operon